MNILTTDELNELIATDEGYSLEFKRTAAHLGREICAFANSAGGIVLIGVDDDGSIVGITNMNRVKSEVQNIARSMEPSLMIKLEVMDDILAVVVPSGPDKPYSANGKFYLRDASSCQQMSRDEIREFFFKEGLIQFDRQSCIGFSLEDDFDPEKYSLFANVALIPEELQRNDVLINLKVVENGQMTNAGALVFSRDVSKFFLQASVVCVLFQGTSKSKVLDKQVFAGGVAFDFDGAMTWLLAHMDTEYIIGAGARVEKLELPEAALREGLLNAVAHRDYRFSDHIQVNLFRDRVEIINSGGLVSGLEQKDLGRVSRPRNPLLFSLLERMNLVENIGSGIKRMRNAMRKYGCDEPIIEVAESWFSISFPRSHSGPDSGPDSGPGSIREKILLALMEKSHSRSQLAEVLGHKGISGKLKLRMKELLKEELIEMTIPDKPSSRLQKYRLTEKGVQNRKNL
ncbi:MAG: putative DNA binding domain-containing protein [Kiritimatiellae bacterium]|jgi:ATP-dependent DNA helicase RecG|nr:putative DNA binding domain-containing protein [Kiritimatiellia bacterium]